MKTFTSKAHTRMKLNKPDKTRPLRSIPLEEIAEELRLRGLRLETQKEKQTKVTTIRLFGIKILTITTETPSLELDLLSARSGTDEASL